MMSTYTPKDPAKRDGSKAQAEAEAFIKDNMGIAFAAAAPYRGLNIYEDLVQEATIGLLKAFVAYDEERDAKLSTFACTCAQNEIRQYLRKGNAKCRAGSTTSLDSLGDDEEFQGRLLDQVLYKHFLKTGNSIESTLYTQMVYQAAVKIIQEELDSDLKVVVIHFMRHVPQSQTAKELNITQGNVSKKLQKTFLLLRKRLREMGFDDWSGTG